MQNSKIKYDIQFLHYHLITDIPGVFGNTNKLVYSLLY
jgi:hypothetical protein